MLRQFLRLLSNVRIILARSVLTTALLTAAPTVLAFEAQINASAKSIAVTAADQEVKYLSLIVWDESGAEVLSKVSDGSRLVWVVGDETSDGSYKYEVKLSNIAVGSRSRGATTKNGEADATEAKVSTQSGSVLIRSGSIVPSVEEGETGALQLFENGASQLAMALIDLVIPPAHADILQNDDVISTFSHCIGNDCVNGENFDFDTLRLKENNLRIHFQDTSSSASFPTSDWRIVINDSSNGGSNYFGIDDATAGRNVFRLEAGAPSNSLFVDSSGNLGLGTSNPMTAIEAATGNNPVLRLNQNSSEGFQAQAWDVGGNELGFFVRDFTNGSTLPFQMATGAPTDSFVVNSAGNIGVGIKEPTEKLHVMGNAIVSGNLELGSSRTIKNQIKNLGLEQALAAFDSLEPVLFRYNHSPDEQAIGFIAEDVPDLVATQSRKSLKPMDIIAVLTKVVQEQQKTIDELSGKINGLLESRVSTNTGR